jgi:predicted amidohydrolase
MIIATAQTKPIRNDTKANLLEHYRLINLAVSQGADLIVFPEMSITGYERENANRLAFSENDARLDGLKKLAVAHKITIIAGAPIQLNSKLFIGEFCITPDNSIAIYTKQFLHSGEGEYFKSSFKYNPVVRIENELISFAICADIDNPLHPEKAFLNKTSLYIASIFFSSKGIPKAHQSLSNYAKKYNMNILMSNFAGESYGSLSGGKSAFWNKNGELIAQMNDSDSGLLVLECKNNNWTGKIIYDHNVSTIEFK